MTMRQFGEMAIKVLGLYYAAGTIFGVAALISGFFLPRTEGFPKAEELLLMNSIPLVASAAVAGLYLFAGRWLATILFSDEVVAPGGVPKREWLFVGISLLGLVWVLSAAPAILEGIGKALWYAEDSRAPMFEEVMGRAAEGLVSASLSAAIGVGLILSAPTLARRIDTGWVRGQTEDE
jgi:hypothetical protein